MPLISIIIILIIIGLVLWLIGYLPIPQPIRNVVYVLVILAIIIWLLSLIGVLGGHVTTPRIR